MNVGRGFSGSGAVEAAGEEPAASVAVTEDDEEEDDEPDAGDYNDTEDEDDVRGGSASDDDSNEEEDDEDDEGSEGYDVFLQEGDDASFGDYEDGLERGASENSEGFEDLDLMYPEGEDAMDEDDASEGGPIDEDDLPIGDHPAFGRYFKMLAVGLPEDAVWNKVLRDTAAGTSGLEMDEVERDRELLEGAGLTMNDLDVDLPWREQLDALAGAGMGEDSGATPGTAANRMSMVMEEDEFEEEEEDDKDDNEVAEDPEETEDSSKKGEPTEEDREREEGGEEVKEKNEDGKGGREVMEEREGNGSGIVGALQPPIVWKTPSKDEPRGGVLEEVPAGAAEGEGEATVERPFMAPLAAPQAPPVDDHAVPPSKFSTKSVTFRAAADEEGRAGPKEEAEARANEGRAGAIAPAALAGGAAEGTVQEKTSTKARTQSSTVGSSRLALMRGLARSNARPPKMTSLSGSALDEVNTDEPAKETESTTPPVPRRVLDRSKARPAKTESLIGSELDDLLDGDASSTSISESATLPSLAEQPQGSTSPEQSKEGASKGTPPTIAMSASIVHGTKNWLRRSKTGPSMEKSLGVPMPSDTSADETASEARESSLSSVTELATSPTSSKQQLGISKSSEKSKGVRTSLSASATASIVHGAKDWLERSRSGSSTKASDFPSVDDTVGGEGASSGKSESTRLKKKHKKSHKKSKRKKMKDKLSKSEDSLKSSMRNKISRTKDEISRSENSSRSSRRRKEDVSRSVHSRKGAEVSRLDVMRKVRDDAAKSDRLLLKTDRRTIQEKPSWGSVSNVASAQQRMKKSTTKRTIREKPSWGSVSKAAEAQQRMKTSAMMTSEVRPTRRNSAMPTQDLRALLRHQRSDGVAKVAGSVSDGRMAFVSQPAMMASKRHMGGKDKVMKASRALMIQHQLMQRSMRMPMEERPVLPPVQQLTPHQVLRRQYRSYKQVIAENDDSLPPDVDAINEITDDDNVYGDDEKHDMYNEVRMKMIEDGRTEMEIVAFFEGIALNDFKVRSLESQVESLKSKSKTASTTMEMAMATWAVRQRTAINTELAAAKFASRGKLALLKKVKTAAPSALEEASAMTNATETKTKAMAAPAALASVVNDEDNKGEAKGKSEGVKTDKAGVSDADSDSTEMDGGKSAESKAKSGEKERNESGKDTSKSDRRSKMKDDKDKLGSESMRKIIDSENLSPETDRVLRELEDMRKLKDKLERQLNAAGIKIAEDIPYEEAKNKIQEIAKRMGEIGSSDVVHPDKEEQKKLREEYFTLEQDMERYNAAMTSSDEYIQQQKDAEQKWEDDHLAENLEALKAIRRYMPVTIKRMSENELCNSPSPNGNYLPKKFAKRFKRINVLGVLRLDPDDLTRLHPASLENYRVTGLTLTERRAIYHHIRPCGAVWTKNKSEPMSERKYNWFNMMRNNFKENLAKYERHVLECGPPDNHSCTLIGNQCPVKADIGQFHYKDDYGHPDGDVYEVSDVKKAEPEDSAGKAAREAAELAKEKKAAEREKELKKHYKKKLVELKQANGSCEAMDTAMDNMEFNTSQWVEKQLEKEGKQLDEGDKKKEIALCREALNELKLSVLGFAKRSGMKISGAKGGKANPDKRSALECKLCEEVIAAFDVFSSGIEARMKEIKCKDETKAHISTIKGLLVELHEINQSTLKSLGVEKYEPERKIKNRKEVFDEMKKKLAEELAAANQNDGDDYDYAPPDRPPAMGGLLADISGRGGGGRGGLMGAIAARGRGRGGGGRGDLMGAIAARGRGGRGGGGRGDLMGAIAARGRGGGAGRGGGGRGDLMGAIAARGRGGRPGQGGGGRGDLLGAIAARGRGGRPGQGGGGRGDLLGAIAARGRGGADKARGGGGGRSDLMGAIAARGRGGRPGQGGGGRGDLLGAIAARGRGGADKARGGGGGRDDLMGAIAARGRGGGDRGRGGGSDRADLMGAIASQGRGGGDGRGGGGRGDLLSAIAARGQV